MSDPLPAGAIPLGETSLGPSGRAVLASARAEAVSSLGQLVVQRERLTSAMAEVEAKITAHQRDILAIDIALGILPQG